ncbi:MAG: hypothetical protein CYPHOPRED_002034 [Cyphobasidiales sp. Tagirdzhanova-0007]|nr:MAG: hypothetical protein CYPHOPRED_002034 [Cyphobasidiales sp. Tagirdzhanova-0007]
MPRTTSKGSGINYIVLQGNQDAEHVQIAAPPEQCKEWNKACEQDKYTPATLDNLISRYEEPSPFVRWDSPLITIPWTDTQIPIDGICDAIFKSDLRPPTQATVSAQTGTTDYLHRLESTVSSLADSLLYAQATSPGGGSITLTVPLSSGPLPSVKISLTLPARTITIPTLQRMKRQFLHLHKTAAATEMQSEKIAEIFAKYVEDGLQ